MSHAGLMIALGLDLHLHMGQVYVSVNCVQKWLYVISIE